MRPAVTRAREIQRSQSMRRFWVAQQLGVGAGSGSGFLQQQLMAVSGEAAFVEGDELFEALVEEFWVCDGVVDAVADVVFEEFGFEGAEGGVDGADGVEDFRAFAVVFDHAADPIDLAGDFADAGEEWGGGGGVAVHVYTHGGYIGWVKGNVWIVAEGEGCGESFALREGRVGGMERAWTAGF
jgi:hypothetical protein